MKLAVAQPTPFFLNLSLLLPLNLSLLSPQSHPFLLFFLLLTNKCLIFVVSIKIITKPNLQHWLVANCTREKIPPSSTTTSFFPPFSCEGIPANTEGGTLFFPNKTCYYLLYVTILDKKTKERGGIFCFTHKGREGERVGRREKEVR